MATHDAVIITIHGDASTEGHGVEGDLEEGCSDENTPMDFDGRSAGDIDEGISLNESGNHHHFMVECTTASSTVECGSQSDAADDGSDGDFHGDEDNDENGMAGEAIASPTRRVESVADDARLPSLEQCVETIATCICCPISMDVFQEPILASDGWTYDKDSFERLGKSAFKGDDFEFKSLGTNHHLLDFIRWVTQCNDADSPNLEIQCLKKWVAHVEEQIEASADNLHLRDVLQSVNDALPQVHDDNETLRLKILKELETRSLAPATSHEDKEGNGAHKFPHGRHQQRRDSQTRGILAHRMQQ